MQQKIKIWDFAVRFFHWSQVLLLAGLWYTGEQGMMAWHQLLAYTLAAVLLSRIIWGFCGSQTARFSQFASTPLQAVRYLRQGHAVAGHNPASFYMIIALILLVLLQLLSGLATFDNSYMSDGPLVSYLPSAWVDAASDFHKLNINLILSGVAIHVLAALWHSWRHQNVIGAMFTGSARFKAPVAAPQLKNSIGYFVVMALLLVIFYFWQGQKLLALL
ncbi:cytochrome b/b6 domain-containing protein [Chromatiaceae bacterium AAb-1]|nr:cytochrome b/b6 domain-containing protein [Chromatiaceae bacterium AAb-1]